MTLLASLVVGYWPSINKHLKIKSTRNGSVQSQTGSEHKLFEKQKAFSLFPYSYHNTSGDRWTFCILQFWWPVAPRECSEITWYPKSDIENSIYSTKFCQPSRRLWAIGSIRIIPSTQRGSWNRMIGIKSTLNTDFIKRLLELSSWRSCL